MITDRLISYAAGAACLALSIALFFTYAAKAVAERRADKAEVTLSQDREAAATANAQLVQKARETEQTLTAKAAQIEGEKNEQITALDARAAALTRRLRDAAATSRLVSAASATASAGEAAAVCDAGGLSDRVGDGLVGLALRADQVRIQLASCESQYDGARAALSAFSEHPTEPR